MGHDGSVNDEGTGTDGTDGAGVVLSHLDGFGRPCRPSDRTIEAVHRAMGLDRPDDLTATASIVMITGEQGPEVSSGTELHLEDGTTVSLVCTAGPTRSPERRPIVPPDIPIGYHQLIGPNGTARPLLVSPGRCPLPVDLPIWGVTAQLYAARGSRSWGIGDLGDLATLNGWVTRRGGAVVGLNPLHAPTPSPRPPDSPYSPSTRLWRDPSSIDVEAVPGFTALTDAEEKLAATLAQTDHAADKDVARLVAVYERMKPKDAAPLFEEMAPEFAAGFLARMRPEAAAAVMAGLAPPRAYAISVLLAGRNAKAPKE